MNSILLDTKCANFYSHCDIISSFFTSGCHIQSVLVNSVFLDTNVQTSMSSHCDIICSFFTSGCHIQSVLVNSVFLDTNVQTSMSSHCDIIWVRAYFHQPKC